GRCRGGRGRDSGRRGSARGDRGHRRAARCRHRGRRRFGGRSRRVSGASARRALGSILAVALLVSCTESGQPSRTGPFNDVEGAPKLARDAGALLLQVSAYDYGLAGALAGSQTRTVAAARYGGVMRRTTRTGPYASATEAKQALQRMGAPLNGSFTLSAPFVVRIGPYNDRASADTASAGLQKQGVINVVTDDASYAFARSGPVPDAELWREPSRVQEVRATSRKIAGSSDGAWLLTGSDDGYAALFDPRGRLTALPQGFAGMSVLQFSDGGDAQTFAVGGQVVTFLAVPSGENIGSGMRFTGAATQVLFTGSTHVFVVASGGSTGLAGGGPGLIGGRHAVVGVRRH